jgi:hypothetical protein
MPNIKKSVKYKRSLLKRTDALVQRAIRQCFGDCTVITIAHRLATIMDSDKVIVDIPHLAKRTNLEYFSFYFSSACLMVVS